MNALAQLPAALQLPSLAGQSDDQAMLETDPNEPYVGRGHQVDTLSAEDGVTDASLDDRLLHRDLKARIFGSESRVTIGRYEVLRRMLQEFATSSVAMGREAYAYCVEKADEQGLASEPIVAFCRSRLELYPEP
jgi:hypothetical protein